MADTIWKPHATVAAIVERDGKYLLVKERIKGDIVFNQPAGHLEPGESFIEAVIRETLEETRYEFTPTGLQGIYRLILDENPDVTYIRFLFCGRVGAKLDGKLDEGIISAEWMSYEEIQSCRDHHRSHLVLECIEDYRRKTPCSLDVLSEKFA